MLPKRNLHAERARLRVEWALTQPIPKHTLDPG